ncbi:transmembrane protein 272-like isoform X1 [Penaeus chinensis]|uniref:transmembrane protein 272-like isoform X1 n=1 Tax=Penaeus chinensis TaxID=139456 RepID=UPI001FB6C702|nr:transmembrane protein 272-like isoform X1 [Penaeus chinensis]
MSRPRSHKEVEVEYEDDDGGCGDCLANILQTPVIIIASIVVPVFSVTFVVMGAIFLKDCNIEPMIPVWLLVQGIIMLFGIGTGGMATRSYKSGKSVSLPVKLVSFVVSLATFAWFIGGNVWVYRAWAQDPDYAHSWFENGCNKSVFNIAFYGVIILDALGIISFIVGIVAFCLRGCSFR